MYLDSRIVAHCACSHSLRIFQQGLNQQYDLSFEWPSVLSDMQNEISQWYHAEIRRFEKCPMLNAPHSSKAVLANVAETLTAMDHSVKGFCTQMTSKKVYAT